MAEFILDTPMTPKGDQEKAINEIVERRLGNKKGRGA